MQTAPLKRFAETARSSLIAQVGERLTQVLAIDSRARREHSDAVAQLEARIAADGQTAVLDAVAYTWFNRFCALRFMDVKRYTRAGVVSPTAGHSQPEILAHAKLGDIDDSIITSAATREAVAALLSGKQSSDDPQTDAYRLLVVAACNHWHAAMPFLFEKIEDYTELLMPDDLLSEKSILARFREAMTEDACANIEVIGWLYQYYITDKKDEVIGKVVASEDIPAATQLFTPNWIVKYMVQNSLGAQWLATYPQSPLKGQMEYYIEPAEQTDEVNAQLAAITPSQLNPEELTLIDPASGSGHILVEAYELFKAIYLERGYRQRDVPQLILTQNLFGLDIDERAAQLTGFALMMKGRADDRRLFERGVKLNVMALVDSAGFDAEALAKGVELADYGLQPGDLKELKRLFEHATTFGSLIQVPEELAKKLPALKQLIEATSQDLFVSEALKRLGPLVQQAEVLAAQYDAVVANPPYMGGSYHTATVKAFLRDQYKGYEKDLFVAFIERDLAFSKPSGRLGFMSPFVWMFISSYETLRTRLIDGETITSLVQLEYSGFEGATVPICTFTLQKGHVNGQKGCFIRLSDFRGSGNQAPRTLEAIQDRECGWFFESAQDSFKKIPGSPIAYWLGKKATDLFVTEKPIGKKLKACVGLQTSDNNRFLRYWTEVSLHNIGFGEGSIAASVETGRKWFPHNKGGAFRKWYGNLEYVVNWHNDGQEIREFQLHLNSIKKPSSRMGIANNSEYYFREAASWTDVTSGRISFRLIPQGCIFDVTGNSAFFEDKRTLLTHLAYLNTDFVNMLSKVLNPTLHFPPGYFRLLPSVSCHPERFAQATERAVFLAGRDWDSYERSWDFQSLPLLTTSTDPTPTLESSYTAWITQNRDTIAEMKRLEEENNRLFIDAYGLADELTPDVPIEQITLTVNPAYRYGGKLTEEEQWTRFRQDTMEELVSYAIGCMMGRYSLDAPGLIYAHSGSEGFDHGKYTTFPADHDAIIPILEGNWFTDDIVERMKEFLKVTFGIENYEENLRYLEDGLYPSNLEGKKRKTIREYFLKDFYNNHVQTYKKRPIYWLFSSPKGSFNALIYLHRYRSDTVSTVLNDYLRNFRTKLTARLDNEQNLAADAGASKSDKTKALKETERLKKMLTELEDWEREVLYPLAAEKLEIDLDDGVKHNYPLFGKALKKIAGLS
jgi:type II restriction/modification system DNA methylase subunit YeeA